MFNQIDPVVLNLRRNYVLASVATKCWTATKRSPQAEDIVERETQASDQSVKVSKQLLAGADKEYKAVAYAIGAARANFRAMTLPYTQYSSELASGGTRLLSTAAAEKFYATHAKLRGDFENALDDFVRVYARRRDAAITNLGALGAHEDYPDPSLIREKFAIELGVEPVPDSAGLGFLPSGIMAAAVRELEERQRMAVAKAQQHAWERVTDIMERLTRQLEPGSRLYASTFEELRQLCDALDGFNITNDPALAEIKARLDPLAGFDADDLRDDQRARVNALRHAASVKERLVGLGYA